jgi:hypothetical protein
MKRNLLKIPIGWLRGDFFPSGAFPDFVPEKSNPQNDLL